VSLAGCRSDRALPAVAAAAPASPQRAAATSPNVITFTATEYGYQGPKEIPAGPTEFRLSNHGKELHHLIIARLDGGKTYDSLLVALKKPGMPPAWTHPVGGPNAADPGGESNATEDLTPGHYAVLCYIPSADGVPHVAKGMISSLEVTPGSSTAMAEPRRHRRHAQGLHLRSLHTAYRGKARDPGGERRAPAARARAREVRPR